MTSRPRDIWTRLAIDPVADPLARLVAPRRGVTPNRVTAVSGCLGIAAVACFATGRLAVGGVLFLLRFLTDCVDGKVARLQGTASARGAALDVATDVVCVTGAYAALSVWLAAEGHIGPAWAGALLAAVGCYGWSLAHRKHLADEAGLGSGGSDLHLRDGGTVPLLGRWLALCRRLGMSPVPWAVEAETLVLGLLPLAGPEAAAAGVLVGVAFYTVATTTNLARLARITGVLDRRTVLQPVQEDR